ncbi:MAG: 3'(2'),5'-bisphosphate nucleotidase CysQ [Alphaproteobacteria bacterium]
MPPADVARLTDEVRRIARAAGDEIMARYRGTLVARTKADSTPVTEADEAAERLVLAGLRGLTPDIPIVAEESVASGAAPTATGDLWWLVDPLDGTKELLSRNGEFTVNVALIEKGRPVLGVVHAPAVGRTYFAGGPGPAFAELAGEPAQAIRARTTPAEGAVVAVSRSHRNAATDRYLAQTGVASEVVAGSALKFGLVASGEADLYPRIGPTMEWDTAAGQAVLAAAGGSVRTLDGRELRYGKPGFLNPPFVARGRDE